MAASGIKGGGLKVLSKKEIHDIHISTLKVLEEVGVKVDYRPALELMVAKL